MFQKLFGKLHDTRKETAPARQFPDTCRPVLRKSICSGETTAGFKDLKTGKYTEVMLIRDEKDLKQFMSEYGIVEKPETEY